MSALTPVEAHSMIQVSIQHVLFYAAVFEKALTSDVGGLLGTGEQDYDKGRCPLLLAYRRSR
jgi:hypothetical protein